MSSRYYLDTTDSPPLVGNVVCLEGDEAHHLARVMRRSAGETVCLFNGQGIEYVAKITEITKQRIFLTVETIHHSEITEITTGPKVTLVVALPKGDRQKWMVEKLTELGCSRLIPLQTQRGVAESDHTVSTRLKRQVLEATKQCGRTILMTIEPSTSIPELERLYETEHSNSTNTTTIRLVAEPMTVPLSTYLAQHFTPQVTEVVIAVGPEGGFAPNETEWFGTHGWQRVSLGPHILRVETAAIAGCSLLIHYSANNRFR